MAATRPSRTRRTPPLGSSISRSPSATPYTYQPPFTRRRRTRPSPRSSAALLRGLEPRLGLEAAQPLLERLVAVAAREERIAFPPVDPHLLRLVGGGDEQAEPDGEQLDVEQADLDVAGDHDALVEHPLEHVGELRRRRPAACPSRIRALAHDPDPSSASLRW